MSETFVKYYSIGWRVDHRWDNRLFWWQTDQYRDHWLVYKQYMDIEKQ